MKNLRPDNVVIVKSTLDTVFKNWFIFLKPLHYLTEREIDVAASFMKQRYLLSKSITDEDLLDKIVMNEDTKRVVREDCQITLPHFQVIMGKLRKSKVIIDNKINPRFIPNVDSESNNFQLLLLFDLQ
jgi:hypothetical protein